MQLRFLGQTYVTANRQLKTVPSDYTARFLGRVYTPSLPIATTKSELGLRKYRGVSYKA